MAMAERLVASANPGSPSAGSNPGGSPTPEVGHAGGQPVYAPGSRGPDRSPSRGGTPGSRGSGAGLDSSVREEIRRYLLERYDQDHDGHLDKREIRSSAYYSIGKQYLKYFDRNGNGRLDGDEYRAIGELVQQFGGRGRGPMR
jgi:hypothetical protein